MFRTFGIDEVDVGHAEEAEHGLQVRRLRVGGSATIAAAAGEGDEDLLALEQALGAVLGVAEGDAGAGDSVDPVLELRGDAEVVHRHANDDDVSRLHFGDQRVADRHAGDLLGCALLGRRKQCAKCCFVDHRCGVTRQVALHKGRRRIGRLQAGDDVVGDAGGVAGVGTGAAIDLQDLHVRDLMGWGFE